MQQLSSEAQSSGDLRQLPDAEIETRAASAGAEREKLRAESARADEAAQRAAAAFESAPSQKTLAEREITAQLAKNAQAALDKHAAEVAPIFDEATRRIALRRLKELDTEIAVGPHVSAAAARIAEAYEQVGRVIVQELRALDELLTQQSNAVAEFNRVSQRIGAGRRVHAISFEQTVAEIAAVLRSRLGSIEGGGPRAADLRMWEAMGQTIARLEMRLPVK